MALSIKDKNKDLPIALICDTQSLAHISKKDMWVFDKIIQPDFDHAHENGVMNPFKLKTFIYDYSPFEKTIYLDVDGMFIGDAQILLSQTEGVEFQIQEVKRYTKESAKNAGVVWTKNKSEQQLPKLWDLYNLFDDAIYPEYNSSFIFFKKSKYIKTYFDLVKKMYGDRKFSYTKIGGFYPDEMAFGLASAVTGLLGAKEVFKPVFFAWENKIQSPTEIEKKFSVLGMAGGQQVGKMIQYYNAYAKAMSIRHNANYFPFNEKSKIFFKQ